METMEKGENVRINRRLLAGLMAALLIALALLIGLISSLSGLAWFREQSESLRNENVRLAQQASAAQSRADALQEQLDALA